MHIAQVSYSASGLGGSAGNPPVPFSPSGAAKGAAGSAPATMPSSLNHSTEMELLNMTLPTDPKFVGFARRAVSQVLHQLKFDKRATDDIVLAVGEASNNAVAYPGEAGGSHIYIVCRLIPLPGASAASRSAMKTGTLQIDIRNHGDGFARSIDESRYEMPAAELMGEHGRGLPLMMAFLDRVQVLSENGDTIVRLEKALPGGA